MFLKPGVKIDAVDQRKLLLAWWPFSIISFDSCPGNLFLIDLVIASESKDPLPLILTMRRYRNKYRLEPSPPVEAPIVVVRGAGPTQILESILKIYRGVREKVERGEEIDMRSLRRAAIQMRIRRPHTLEEALANVITRGILSEILSSICVKGENVRISSYTPIYILIGVNRSRKEFYIYMERRLRSINHEIYALEVNEIREILDKYQIPGKLG